MGNVGNDLGMKDMDRRKVEKVPRGMGFEVMSLKLPDEKDTVYFGRSPAGGRRSSLCAKFSVRDPRRR